MTKSPLLQTQGDGTEKLSQKALSQKMQDMGKERVRRLRDGIVKSQRFADWGPGAAMKEHAFDAVLAQIKSDMKRHKIDTGGKSKEPMLKLLPLLRGATPEQIAGIGVVAIMDCLLMKMTWPQACGYIGRALDFELMCDEFRKKYPNYWKEVERERKRRGTSRAKEALKKIGRQYAMRERSSTKEHTKAGLYVLSTFMHCTDIATVDIVYQPNKRITRFLVPSPQALQWIEESVEEQIRRQPYYLPCAVPPADWTDPVNGGYAGLDVLPRPLVKSHSKSYVKALEKADLSRVYEAVNVLQRCSWSVNQDVLGVAEDIYKTGQTMAGCHSGERMRATPKWPEVDTDIEQRRIYRRLMARVFEVNRNGKIQRLGWGRTVATAKLFADQPIFYPHHLDFRGRVYPTPSALSPQGDDLNVGLIRFSESQTLKTDRDWFWVKVHGANTFGADKVPFEERLLWVEKHAQEIQESAKNPLDFRWWADADKPMQFLAWCKDYCRAQDSRRFEWTLPITVDGSNNGLQIYSFLLRDPVGGAATNCVPGPRPCDIYQDVADVATKKLKAKAEAGEDLAQRWLEVVKGRLPRSATKRSVMTLVYGATRFACLRYTAEWWGEHAIATGSREFAVNMYRDVQYLAGIIWESIADVVSAARKGMDWFRKVADVFTENEQDIYWTTPSGFEVMQRYSKLDGGKQLSLSFGRWVETCAHRDQTSSVDSRRQRNGLPPNVIHSLDAAVLVDVVNRVASKGVKSFRAVHDSYGSLPRHMDVLSDAVRHSYSDTFSDDWLANLHAQWQGQLPKGVSIPNPPKQGLMSVEAVKRSLYFFA